MWGEDGHAESTVSGNQATIPASIRRELDIDDGDKLRWHIEDDGTLRVQVVQQRGGTFSDFDGYEDDHVTDVQREHDTWGVDAGKPAVDGSPRRPPRPRSARYSVASSISNPQVPCSS